jgi:hypothetical protein
MKPIDIPQRILALLVGEALAGLAGPARLQHDQNIANADGASVRSDINNALAALFSLSSGGTAPSTTVAYQLWADTTNGVLKQRNAANTSWIVRGSLSESIVVARSSNTILGVSNFGNAIVATSTFTQTLTAAATLGDGWFCYYRNDGTGVITLDPNGAETIDGSTTLALNPGESVVILCNGSAFKTIGRTVTAADNFLVDATVASNALTLTIKAGSVINFRESSLTAGTQDSLTLAADVSVVISNGSNLGFSSSQKSRIYLGAMNNGGTVEAFAYHANGASKIQGFSESNLISTTAEGGAGGADAAHTAYSTTARSNLPWHLVGWIEITTGATAGQWSASPTKIQPMRHGIPRHGDVVQIIEDTGGGSATTSTSQTDVTGASADITPSSDVNKVIADFRWHATITTVFASEHQYYAQVLRGATNLSGETFRTSALASGSGVQTRSGHAYQKLDNPLTTSTTTYKLQHRTTDSGSGATTTAVTIRLTEVFV